MSPSLPHCPARGPPGPSGRFSCARLPALAEGVPAALCVACPLLALDAEIAALREQVADRKVIRRAIVVIMEHYRWTEKRAFAALQRHAMNRRVRMVDLSRLVLQGHRHTLAALARQIPDGESTDDQGA